jgi:imidazolonepropionase-like amidohydrolase
MKSMKWLAASAAGILTLLTTAYTTHAQAPAPIAIRAGRLFDSKSGKLLDNQVILLAGEKIAEVGSAERVQIPKNARVIDLSNATVLPGLIDGHTHVFGFGLDGLTPGGPPFATPINDTREYRTLLALANAQKDLRAGFTTLRDLMSHGGGYADVDIKRAINRGYFEGPRMQVSTMGLVATGAVVAGPTKKLATSIAKYTPTARPLTGRTPPTVDQRLLSASSHPGAPGPQPIIGAPIRWCQLR